VQAKKGLKELPDLQELPDQKVHKDPEVKRALPVHPEKMPSLKDLEQNILALKPAPGATPTYLRYLCSPGTLTSLTRSWMDSHRNIPSQRFLPLPKAIHGMTSST
jgi:hypothetical protein